MAAGSQCAVRVRAGARAVGAAAALLLALAAGCYPNADDLRGSTSGSGGFRGLGGFSGSVGGHGGTTVGGTGGAMGTQCGGPACGGNLLGTWSFVNSCSPPPMGDCPGEVLDGSGVHFSGTISFNAAGTYSSTETDTGTIIFDVPTACLNGLTCAELDSGFQGPGYVGSPDPTFSSASCSTTSTGCHCLLGALGTPVNITGTYAASGTSVTLTSSTGVTDADTYCVQGSILHLMFETSTPADPDESVFVKQ